MAFSFVILTGISLAGWIFTERRGAKRTAAIEADFPPTGQILMVNGSSLHVDIRGSGPDLVLIHGASGNTRDMTVALADQLTRDFRVITFDRPGLGWSQLGAPENLTPEGQAATLRAAAEQLGVQSPIIMGHSYGGAVALAWALQAADATGGLVLLSAASMPWPGKIDPLYRLMKRWPWRSLIPPLVAAFAGDRAVNSSIAAIFTPQQPPPGYIGAVGALLSVRAKAFGTNADQVNMLRKSLVSMSRNYPGLAVPIAILHGDTDTIVPHSVHAQPLMQLLPNATLTLLPGVGHMPHHSHAAEVVRAIQNVAKRAHPLG